MSKEKHSPTPWSFDGGLNIFDANGREINCPDCYDDNMRFIVDAVNLYALLDAARTDGEGYKHILTMKGEDGKPTCIITPPVSETELVRMYKTENHNLFKDRIMLERQRNELWHERNRLRDLVRRLAEFIRHSIYDCGGQWDIEIKSSDSSLNYHGNANNLLREASDAIGEGNR